MEPYTPTFYEGVYHTPAFKGDGVTPNLDQSYKTYVSRREMATPETAHWVGQVYKADSVDAETYLGMGEAFDENGQSVKQFHVTIQGVPYVAGHIAYYFTQRKPGDDVTQENQTRDDRGMWPSDMAPEKVMEYGKVEADKWVASGKQYQEPET